MDRTMSVRGTGRISVKPDIIELSMTLVSRGIDYPTTMQKADEDYNKLQNAIVAVGFKKEDLKTVDFSVNSEYEFVADEKGEHRQVFKGYVCNHSLLIDFPLDMELLGKTLAAVTESGANPNLAIAFSVKDRESVTNELMKRAVEDAKQSAETLAYAAGVRLGMIVTLEYGQAAQRLFSPTTYNVQADRVRFAKAIDITPEDVKAEENVNIAWELK